MKFLLMPLELLLMVVFVARYSMNIIRDDEYETEAALPIVGHDACA